MTLRTQFSTRKKCKHDTKLNTCSQLHRSEENTRAVKEVYLQQALHVSDDLLPLLEEVLYRYTGGIPRLVCRTLASLLFIGLPIPNNIDEIEKVFALV